jgi:hypothetical protein
MWESMLVTHAGPSQEGIEPIVHCSNRTHYTLSYLEIMEVMLIACWLSVNHNWNQVRNLKFWIKEKGKDIDAIICHGTTLQVAPNFS